MDVDQELAVAQLKALAKVPGSLKVITAMVRPDLRADADDPRSPLAPKHDPELLKRPETMVLHDVVKIEGPDEHGHVTAHTAEGDYTQGQAVAVLKRLQEWRG